MGNNPVTGIKRVINAVGYSMQGLKAAWLNEAAFRQECLLLLILLPAAAMLGESTGEKILLVGAWVLVMIVELLNSAVEAVVDRVGEDYHELAGRAKDLGSAAVMVSILLAFCVWVAILYP